VRATQLLDEPGISHVTAARLIVAWSHPGRFPNEAAFARYLATEQGRRGVLITLVADVASNYLLLRQLDLQLEVARRTVESNDETVDFYRERLEGGVSNRLEVDQAVANRSRTATTIPEIETPTCETPRAVPRRRMNQLATRAVFASPPSSDIARARTTPNAR